MVWCVHEDISNFRVSRYRFYYFVSHHFAWRESLLLLLRLKRFTSRGKIVQHITLFASFTMYYIFVAFGLQFLQFASKDRKIEILSFVILIFLKPVNVFLSCSVTLWLLPSLINLYASLLMH